MSKAVGKRFQILDFGKWRAVRAGVIVNGNWLKWQNAGDMGVARPGAWKEILDERCGPHMGTPIAKVVIEGGVF